MSNHRRKKQIEGWTEEIAGQPRLTKKGKRLAEDIAPNLVLLDQINTKEQISQQTIKQQAITK